MSAKLHSPISSPRRKPGSVESAKREKRRPVDSIQGTPAFAGVTVDRAGDLLHAARLALAERGKPSAALDARLLLQHAAQISHEALIADPGRPVPAEAVARFEALLRRRLADEPVSRILGLREFYGRPFKVTPATLDPRPDTETLIEAALAFMPADRSSRLIDLGTGTGIIGVTLLAERPKAEAVMTDISEAALAVARDNARHHGVEGRSTFITGSWFAGVDGRFDLILSNPPYIPQAILGELAPEVRDFDPETALAGGVDGLKSYHEIAKEAARFLTPGGHVIVEIGEGQAVEIEAIFKAQGFVQENRWEDLAGHVRCLGFSHA